MSSALTAFVHGEAEKNVQGEAEENVQGEAKEIVHGEAKEIQSEGLHVEMPPVSRSAPFQSTQVMKTSSSRPLIREQFFQLETSMAARLLLTLMLTTIINFDVIVKLNSSVF